MSLALTETCRSFGLLHMDSTRLRPIIGCAVFFLLTQLARADVRLPGLFSDNMVLQRGAHAPVWGWADDSEEVTVTFRGQTVKATAKNGKWMVHLSNLEASASSKPPET